jgi:hypothetical protein
LLSFLGAWGLLGTAHVLFGVFQFTAYQREGWSLLVAVACIGGLAASRLFTLAAPFPGAILLSWGAGAAMLTFSLVRPPGHILLNSGAEEEIVRFVRALQKDDADSVLIRGAGVGDHADNPFSGCGTKRKWIIVSRRFPQFGVVKALVDREGTLVAREVHKHTDIEKFFERGLCYLIVVDNEKLPEMSNSKVLGEVSPSLVKRFRKIQVNLLRENARLENYARELEKEGWHIADVSGLQGFRVLALHQP